jgi:hypothetical protein
MLKFFHDLFLLIRKVQPASLTDLLTFHSVVALTRGIDQFVESQKEKVDRKLPMTSLRRKFPLK